MPTSPVDTRKASRRPLHLNTIDEALADVESLARAEHEGHLHTSGNWTAGQLLGHLSSWVDYSYDGVPFKIPTLVKWMVKPFKKKFLYKPMSPGMRIGKLPAGTAGIDGIPFAEGLERFRKNFNRLKASPPTTPHAIFGPLTPAEWHAVHLRHAELHLSFLHAEAKNEAANA